MRKDNVADYLKQLGLKKQFKPYMEAETGVIMLETRKPVRIVNGLLKGCEISLGADGIFCVWTQRKRLANDIAKRYGLRNGLRIRLLDGEAELNIPASLADELLPKFGAKVKRQSSSKQLEALKRARQSSTVTHSLRKKSCAKASCGVAKSVSGSK